MARTVGIRELRDHLSAILREVAEGRTVRIQQRGRTIALLSPAEDGASEADFDALLRSGLIEGDGIGPFGLSNAPAFGGKPVSDAVVQDRR